MKMRGAMSHRAISYDNPIVTAALPNVLAQEAFAAPAIVLRRHLQAPGFLAWLSAIVRRRVPSSDVDDVVQAVLCAALDSSLIPVDEGEIGRWICGITRNKVADFHRRANRELTSEDDVPVQNHDGEIRLVLRAVVSEASSTARGQEELEWIVREHEGEELSRIAEELRLPAPAVRQRVSRLRRTLRSRFLGVSGVLAFALVTAAGFAELKRWRAPEIVADTAGSPLAKAFLTDIDGDWIIAPDQASIPDFAKYAHVRVDGARLVVEIAGIDHPRVILVDAVNQDAIEADLRGDGEDRHVTVKMSGADLIVSEGQRSVRLVRP